MMAGRVEVKVVSEVLGHSQSSFTMDRYQHVDLNMQRQAASRVDSLIASDNQRDETSK